MIWKEVIWKTILDPTHVGIQNHQVEIELRQRMVSLMRLLLHERLENNVKSIKSCNNSLEWKKKRRKNRVKRDANRIPWTLMIHSYQQRPNDDDRVPSPPIQ
jgi:hypothetical protein